MTAEGTDDVSAGRGEPAATPVPEGTANPQVAPDARPRAELPAFTTTAAVRNALRALGIGIGGTSGIASVLITPSMIAVVDLPGEVSDEGVPLAGTRTYQVR